jgi:nucleotide-binding universal stress UspA family protein
LYVVAVDGSRQSHRALDAAVVLAKGADARLEIVTVQDFLSIAHKTRKTPDPHKVMRVVRESADSVVGRARLRASKQGIDTRGAVLEGPNPGHAIVQRAQKDGAELIIVGSRGRTPIRRILLGSVAESVVRHAPCTVVVVR